MADRERLRVLVTRRETFTRLERLETFGGDGPLIEVPDHHDVETSELLEPGQTLKEAAEVYRLDPAVVAIREDRG
jgi:hypothetical protein